MIYFMQYCDSKPKRIEAKYALDFYQMWFGNEVGERMFTQGDRTRMPDMPNFQLWGEEIVDSVWFKKILTGACEDGYVTFDGTFSGTTDSWNSL